jgi:hypothetical protein
MEWMANWNLPCACFAEGEKQDFRLVEVVLVLSMASADLKKT